MVRCPRRARRRNGTAATRRAWRCAADDPRSIVVLDAGTGIRALGAALPPDTRRVDILLSHLHMDHIIGLGFFAGLFRPGLEVHIWGPSSTVLPSAGAPDAVLVAAVVPGAAA